MVASQLLQVISTIEQVWQMGEGSSMIASQ
jgi:hypothetical protein